MRNADCWWAGNFATVLLPVCEGDQQPAPQPPAAQPTTAATTVSVRTPPEPTTPDPERGAYLATLSGCEACHTAIDFGSMKPDATRAYAGGMELPTPFGKISMPNLTPDNAAGVGRWTVQQLADSIRENRNREGRTIFGPHIRREAGWAKVKPEDALAIAGYLKRITPIDNTAPKSTFNPRYGPLTGGGPPPGAGPPAGAANQPARNAGPGGR
jgi:hypothetical protein